MSGNGYYFEVHRTVLGPVDNDYLRQLIHGGAIQADTMVREGEHGEWVSANSVPEISLLLEERCPISPSKSSSASVAFLIGIIAAFFFCLTSPWGLDIVFSRLDFVAGRGNEPGPAGAAGWLIIMVVWMLGQAAFVVMVLAFVLALILSLFGKRK